MVALLSGCGESTGTGPADGEGVVGEYVWFGGVRRTYDLYIPSTADPAAPTPLVLFFHGAGGTGADFRRFTEFDLEAERLGFLLASPDAIGGSWALGCNCTAADLRGVDDLGFVQVLLEQLRRTYRIDDSRVYAAGFSQGAMLSQVLACDHADRFAAVASVGSTAIRPHVRPCSPELPVSILFMVGDEDDLFLPDETFLGMTATVEYWRELNGCSEERIADPPLDELDDGTVVLRTVYRDCRGGSEVERVEIEGAGHTWPHPTLQGRGRTSREINASVVVADFLRRHSRE
jgi:polyhydroxybutyrate depolymerase